jgi:Tol biopolymer transport system component
LKDLLIGDLSRGVLTPLDLDSDSDHAQPVWSPDGTRLAFVIRSWSDPRILHWLALRGPASPEPILPPGGIQRTEDWSPDGRFLLYFGARTEGGSGLWVVNLEGEPKPRKLLSGTTDPAYAQFSPDGRWIAYASDESGQLEVYVRPFPSGAGKWKVSSNGGREPRWRRDGKELFYLEPDRLMSRLVAVPIRLGSNQVFEAGSPKSLFAFRGIGRLPQHNSFSYSVAADGQRFLVLEPAGETDAPSMTVVTNWQSQLPGAKK